MRVHPSHALCLMLAACPCLADGPGDGNDEIPNVIVSATRSPQTRELTPVSIEVITSSAIEESGAPHVADLLRSVGTTQVQDNYGDGSRTTVGLRGFGATAASNTLVMIDGRRLNNSDLAPPDLNGIAIRDVERVEIVQGSSAVLFGDQAVGGVVNIITQTPDAPRRELAAELGSLGATAIQAVFDAPFGTGLNLRISGESRRSDGYRDRNELALTDLHGNLQYSRNGSRSFVELQRVVERLELPGALTAAEASDDRTQAQYAHDYADTTTDSARIGTNLRLTDRLSLLGEWTERDSTATGSLSGGTRFDQERHSRSLNPRIESTPGRALITAGADFEDTDYTLTSLFGGFPAVTKSRQRIGSVYAQAVYPLDAIVTATAGFRRARMRNEITDSFAGQTSVNDDADACELGVNYVPRDNVRLYVRSARSFRFPKTDELTFTGIANPVLETQIGRSLEAGAVWRADAFRLSGTLYRIDLEHEIGFDPLADLGFGFFGANNNLDDTRRSGISLALDWSLTQRLTLSSHVDLIDARFRQGPFEGQEIPFVSGKLAHLALRFAPREGLSLYLEAQFTGPRYADGDFDNELTRQGGYAIWNGNLAYEHHRWRVALRLDNLLDKSYSEYVALRWDGVKTYYPLPGRRYHLHMSYRF